MEWRELLQAGLDRLSVVTPAQWCQAFFLLAAGGVLAVAAAPRDARALLIDYGARKADQGRQTQTQQPSAGARGAQGRNRLLSLLDTLTAWTQVPHSWFGTFYILSAACSIFWLAQFLFDGALLRRIASRQADAIQAQHASSPTARQVALGWVMMFAQAARRIYEQAAVVKPSRTSRMWVVHWLLGLGFYLAMSVAIWVDGSAAILDRGRHHAANDYEALLKMVVAGRVFLKAWVGQHQCHKHLAGLKKYSLPDTGMFRRYICPHYTCECLLYLSMAVATAPPGSLCNRTLLCAVVFVAANLGVTASGTRKWYAQKFGASAVEGKWNMVPFVF
ncbi:hypothetical protein VTJ83DRAFT_1020 [Remersonia thermophila]|uniref:Polyprenal reductase n=1 Tax=Remersonia thermophila TaxID=72144 RepID=A0ABR4DQI0_9PEZI